MLEWVNVTEGLVAYAHGSQRIRYKDVDARKLKGGKGE